MSEQMEYVNALCEEAQLMAQAILQLRKALGEAQARYDRAMAKGEALKTLLMFEQPGEVAPSPNAQAPVLGPEMPSEGPSRALYRSVMAGVEDLLQKAAPDGVTVDSLCERLQGLTPPNKNLRISVQGAISRGKRILKTIAYDPRTQTAKWLGAPEDEPRST